MQVEVKNSTANNNSTATNGKDGTDGQAVDGQGKATATSAKEPTIEELKAQVENLKSVQSGWDKSQAEVRKKNEELAAELEKLRKEKMSEAERLKYEQDKKNEELQRKEAEVHGATVKLAKMRILAEKKMNPAWDSFVGGNNDEEIAKNIANLSKLIDSEVEERMKAARGPRFIPRQGTTKASGDANSAFRNAILTSRTRK